MISTSPVSNNAEMGQIISLLLDEKLINDLIIGDIHSPMNKVSDIFKLLNGNEIVSGWSIFHAHDHPIIVFPPKYPDGWNAIKGFVNALQYPIITLIFPKFVDAESTEVKPWTEWGNYQWQHQFTDDAMRFNGDLKIMDISNLPKIRGIGYDERDRLQEFYNQEELGGDYSGIFHPFQILSDLFVVAEDDDGNIIAAAGTHYETPTSVQLGNIYVKKEYRNQGLGKALTTAITLSILRSYRVPTLFVNEQNEVAKNIYQQIGFEFFNKFDFVLGRLKGQ